MVPLTGRRRRLGWGLRISLVVGLVAVLAAAVWTPVAVPMLVKFPTSTNVHVSYTGSLVTYLNAKTGATLARPTSSPLTIDRHVQALPAESSSSVALVKETLAVHAGSTSSTELNVYALDRRSMQAVPDKRAYTFQPGNVPNRGSSYYVTLPMGLDHTTSLSVWKPESGTTYLIHPVSPTSARPASLDGLPVVWYSGSLALTPAPAYERAALKARGFPTALTPTQVQAQLAAVGVSVSKLSTALLPVLSSSEVHTLLAVLAKPVPLQYYIFASGRLAAEPRTGMLIKLDGIVDGVAARPDPAPLRTVMTILQRHQSRPGVRQALSAISSLAARAAQPVYELRYTQTPATVASSVTLARSQISQIRLATLYLPLGLGVLGLLLISPAAASVVRRRRTATRHEPPGSTESGHLPQGQAGAA